jgi:hypothetical protein
MGICGFCKLGTAAAFGLAEAMGHKCDHYDCPLQVPGKAYVYEVCLSAATTSSLTNCQENYFRITGCNE